MKLIGAIVIRLVLYAWLSMWVLFRIKMQPAIFDYILVSVIILMSVLLSFYPYDKNLVKIIVNNRKYTVAFFIVLALIWIQILYEWVLSIENPVGGLNESYVYYGPFLTVMGLPSSIIAVGFRFILDKIPGLSYSTWPHVTLTWFMYFILFFVQLYILYRWLRKRWGDTETP